MEDVYKDCNDSTNSSTNQKKPVPDKETSLMHPPGTMINNRYSIVKELGKGGMGTVYLVKDIVLKNRLVALKQINAALLNTRNLEVFKQEFEVMSRLKHPNLVGVYDFGFNTDSDLYYITMEYVDDLSIKELLQGGHSFSDDEKYSLMVTLCRAVEFIHSRKILHRDINPNNILITKDGTVKLMDFGLADLGKSDQPKKGTLPYMAPEIFKNKVDHRTDIFALGCTFYEILSNSLLYAYQTSQHIINLLLHQGQFTNALTDSLAKIDHPALKAVIGKMTAYNCDDRYQSCTEIIGMLNRELGIAEPYETPETREAYVLGAGFVGRKQQLAQLRDRLDKPNASLTALWVHGDAGVGKSRLFYEFKKYCQLQMIPFFEGNCLQHLQTQFGPLLPVLTDMLLHADDALIEKFGPIIKKVLPDHDRLKACVTPPPLDPQTEYNLLVQTVVACIAACTAKHIGAYVVYINDIQWCDEATIEVISLFLKKVNEQYHSGAPQSSPVYIYLSSRLEGISSLQESITENLYELMQLSPFDERMVQEYVEAVFGEQAIGPRLKNSIAAINMKVGGNPFFLQELMKSFITRGCISRTQQWWELTQDIDTIAIPVHLKDLVVSRLHAAALSDTQKQLLQIAAVLNRCATLDELSKLAAATVPLLHDLERLEILKSQYSNGQYAYRIAHDLIRETIIEQITNTAVLHEQIASSIESIHAENITQYIEELAYHYYHAQNRTKALLYLDRAAGRVQQKYENEKALQFLDMILHLLDAKEIEKRIATMERKVDIYCTTENLRLCTDTCEEIINLADTIQDVKSAMNAHYFLGFSKAMVGDASYINNLQKALSLCTIVDNKLIMAKILSLISGYYLDQKKYEEAKIHILRALEIAEKGEEKVGVYDGLSACYNMASQICHAQGRFEEAIEYGLKLIRIREQMIEECKNSASLGVNIKGIKRNTALAYQLLGMYYNSTAAYDRVFHYYEKGLTLAEEIGNTGMKMQTLCRKGETLFQCKRFQEAKQIVHQIMEHMQVLCNPKVIYTTRLLAAKVSYALGDKQSGKQDLLALLQNTKDVYMRAEIMYELWCMDNEAVYRNEALVLYKDFCSRSSDDYVFKKRLEELERNRCPSKYIRSNPRHSNKHLKMRRNYLN